MSSKPSDMDDHTTDSDEGYLKRILTSRVYEVAIESPLDAAPRLSKRLKVPVYLKREDMQPVFSFKCRGAYNKMASLPLDLLKQGVICASAGNHAQGVALAAHHLKTRSVIVMPITTPQVKVEAVKSWEAELILHGHNFDAAYQHAMALSKEHQLSFIHPFDDPAVIAGQGTIGMEIVRQHSAALGAVFVPVGGGGLLAGIATYIKQIRPEVRIIGVEPFEADALYRSLEAKQRVRLEKVGLFADGVAVREVGQENFRLCQRWVDEVIRVDTDAICAAIKDIFEDTRTVMEPSGALAVAGMKVYMERSPQIDPLSSMIAITSGANLNFDRLRFIAERAEVGERREAILAVCIPEQRGSFLRFCSLIGKRHVTEFNYRITDSQEAHIFVGIAINNREDIHSLVQHLNAEQFKTLDLTDDELAKLHLRHMVGGHSPLSKGERLYRVELLEYPGALMELLTRLPTDANISLFHYRNHGADVGRVLIGLQTNTLTDLDVFFKSSEYRYWEETKHPAYQMFLS